MTAVVADAGPLIGLARVGRLDLLQKLYGTVMIPPAVLQELGLGELRLGAAVLAAALRQGWLVVDAPRPSADAAKLELLLDRGEAEAILLAAERGCQFLLMDDRKGRKVAKRWGLAVAGTGAGLLAAKAKGHIEAVAPILDDLACARYRLSRDLVSGLLERAGEA